MGTATEFDANSVALCIRRRANKIYRNNFGIFGSEFHLRPDFFCLSKWHFFTDYSEVLFNLVIHPLFYFLLFLVGKFMVAKKIHPQSFCVNVAPPFFYQNLPDQSSCPFL